MSELPLKDKINLIIRNAFREGYISKDYVKDYNEAWNTSTTKKHLDEVLELVQEKNE